VLEISLNPGSVPENAGDFSDRLVLVLCRLVWAGRVVSFEGVLSCHSLPMVPTVH